jgi:hypothetical protein
LEENGAWRMADGGGEVRGGSGSPVHMRGREKREREKRERERERERERRRRKGSRGLNFPPVTPTGLACHADCSGMTSGHAAPGRWAASRTKTQGATKSRQPG